MKPKRRANKHCPEGCECRVPKNLGGLDPIVTWVNTPGTFGTAVPSGVNYAPLPWTTTNGNYWWTSGSNWIGT